MPGGMMAALKKGASPEPELDDEDMSLDDDLGDEDDLGEGADMSGPDLMKSMWGKAQDGDFDGAFADLQKAVALAGDDTDEDAASALQPRRREAEQDERDRERVEEHEQRRRPGDDGAEADVRHG